MKLNGLKKGELEEVIELYRLERPRLEKLVSLELFADYLLGRCEDCGKIFVREFDEKLCEECQCEHEREERIEREIQEEDEKYHDWNEVFNNLEVL